MIIHCGDCGHFIKGMGVYRINGNLAVARAIGDRSERPFVSGKDTTEMGASHSPVAYQGVLDGSVIFRGCRY